MTETPHVVVSRGRRAPADQAPAFRFTAAEIPLLGPADPLREYRQRAWDAYQRIPMPTTRDEAWRRTDLRGLQASNFRLPHLEAIQGELPPMPDRLLEPLVDQAHGGQVLLTPSNARVRIAGELGEQGVVFTDLRSAIDEHPELVARLFGQVVRPEEGKFAALAGAFASTGVVLYVPRGVQVEQPLHSLLWGPGVSLAHFSHVLVWLEEGASATFVNEAASPNESGGQTLHAGTVEVYVGAGANLRFVELQSWGNHVWNFTHERARVDRGGTLEWIFGAMGSHLTKNFTDLELMGEGATGRISGFYFANQDQHLDLDTQQNHMAPRTTSDLLYKGALEEQSRSVWQGMIYVAPGAQKTDGYQANRNLVLSRDARADSIPGLEILADDVRCTHGATVGKIDPSLVFYLKSRGIPEEVAKRLVVEGFFDPIMQRIPFEGVRSRFHEAIQEKLRIADSYFAV